MTYTASRHKLAAEINWLPSPYFEISIFFKVENILNWSIIQCVIKFTNFQEGTNKNITFISIWMSGQFMPGAANLCLEAVLYIINKFYHNELIKNVFNFEKYKNFKIWRWWPIYVRGQFMPGSSTQVDTKINGGHKNKRTRK